MKFSIVLLLFRISCYFKFVYCLKWVDKFKVMSVNVYLLNLFISEGKERFFFVLHVWVFCAKQQVYEQRISISIGERLFSCCWDFIRFGWVARVYTLEVFQRETLISPVYGKNPYTLIKFVKHLPKKFVSIYQRPFTCNYFIHEATIFGAGVTRRRERCTKVTTTSSSISILSLLATAYLHWRDSVCVY